MTRSTRTLIFSFSMLALSAALLAQPYPRTDDQRAWNRPFEPFRIIGNIYYVGTADLASYLMTSDAGHVLLDSGLEEDASQLLASIGRLGFSVGDIKVLLNSQAHFDHAAGLAAVKKQSGARLLASVEDAATLGSGGRDDFAFGNDLMFPPVAVDGTVADGQVVRVGPIALTARLTPGHTKGTTTWTMTVHESGRDYRVVFAGSTTINPGVRVLDNPKYPNMKADFDRTYATLKSLEPDVFLSQHGGAFGLADKSARLRRANRPTRSSIPTATARCSPGWKPPTASVPEAGPRGCVDSFPVNWLSQIEAPASALAVLTAMITPAVLISACGSLLLSTSNRLGRVVDRVRVLVAKFEELERETAEDALRADRRQLIFEQLQRQSIRARLLQRALVAFYMALGVFVLCSVAIAVLPVVASAFTWTGVGLGIMGAVFMLYGSMLLIVESRMALGAILSELEFVAKVGRHYGDDLAEQSLGGIFTWLGKKIG